MDERLNLSDNSDEVYYWRHNPESLLTCVRVMAWYLGDGKARVTLPQYSWKMAARVMGLTGKKSKWVAPAWWRGRLKDYGIDPETFRIADERRFGIAWEMLNEYCVEGQPWQISTRTFKERLREVEEGRRDWHRASIVNIPWTAKRRQTRVGGAWRKRLSGADKTAVESRVMQQRIRTFLRDFEEP